ncbi:hypothetical protein SBRCBS47491_000847 [Sporothrix bragantina]|uniref:Zn(2)-C6 fungal-type domain-containing protein n=1 Tax=Sporothrix bragantina TaxID=671064 RepID=A0ABP0AU13_9PEZI
MSPTGRETSSRGRRAVKACSFCRLRKFRCNSQTPCTNCVQYGKDCVYDDLPKRPRPSFARLTALEEENKRLQEALRNASTASQNGTPSRGTPRETSPNHSPAQSPSPSRSRDGSEDKQAQALTKSSPQESASLERDDGNNSDDDADIDCAPGTPPVTIPDTPLNSSPAPHPAPGPRTASTPVIEKQPEPVLPVTTPHAPTTGRGAGNNTRYHGPTSTLFDETAAPVSHGRRQHAPHANNANANGPSTYWVQKSLFAEAASQRHLETINLAAGKLDFDGVDPDLGMHLLRLHWNRQHHSFLITYRPAFMRDMACGGPYFSRLLLNAIFFGASKFSNRPEVRRDPNDVRTAGWLFRERVRQLLGSALDRSDITTIQALLVMTSSLFALGDERSAAWLYAGTAFRMIIDLGMHVDGLGGTSGLSEEDVEIRRRVFWGAFVVDKIQSLYQGRPVSLQEIETNVPLVFHDEYEELENWQPFAYYTYAGANLARDYPGSPAYSVSCFTQLCRLSLIMNGILNAVYAERSVKKKPEALAEDLQRLHADLETWKNELPPHLNFDPSSKTQTTPPPHVLSLLAMHNVLLILLHRPFVSDGHLHANLRALSTRSFMTCAQAATAIVSLLRCYNAAFSVRRAPYLISYATYVAATIHVRIAAQPGFATEAKEALAICLMVFDENSETNWAVKRARAVIGGLMQRMGVSVEAADASTTTAPTTARTGDAEALMALAAASTLPSSSTLVATSPAQSHVSARAGNKRSMQSRDKDLLHTPRRRQRQRLRRDISGGLPGSGGDSTSMPMEATPSAASFSSASASASPAATMAMNGSNGVNGNGNENMPAGVAATFDIDAIISSFMSNQQPQMAGAFKSLPSPDNPQQAVNQPQQSQQQHHPQGQPQPQQHPLAMHQRSQSSPAMQPGRPSYADHFLPSQGMAAAYPSPSPAQHAPTPATMHTPHPVPSAGGHYTSNLQQPQHHHPGGGPWFSPTGPPPPAPPGIPLAYHNAMLQPQPPVASPRFTGYPGGATANRPPMANDEAPQGPWQPGTSGPDSAMPLHANNMHASDLLFGFNSSVLDGVGWEFDERY